MRPHGRARVSARNPRAFGICDRCGFLYNHINLQWQYDWAGASLINKRILVCNECNDVPQSQLRAIVVPADPVPIQNPRIQDFSNTESNIRTTSGQNTTNQATGIPVPGDTVRITQNNDTRVTQETGLPVGLDSNANVPLIGTVTYGVAVPVLSIISNGTPQVNVTCSSAHGLSTNNQISFSGLSNPQADGIYSITVTSSTAFNYIAGPPITTGSLLTNSSKVLTVLVGTPYNYDVVPNTGLPNG